MGSKPNRQEDINKAILGISDKLDKTNDNLEEIRKDTKKIRKDTKEIQKDTKEIQKDTKEISKNSNSKFNKVKAIIGVIMTVITLGISLIQIIQILKPDFLKKPEIYLYSNYKTVMVGQNVDLTSTMNFEAESVYVTAYLESGRQDTLEMNQNNKNEWSKKVYFEEKGTHEIIVTATTSDGKQFEDSIKIKVE